MKIVHVAYGHRPDDIRIFQKECCSLAKCGHQVFYVTSNRNGKVLNGKYNNVQITTICLPYKNIKKSFFFYIKELKKILISLSADIYHFHEDSLLSVLLYMKRQGKYVIYDMHEDAPRQVQPRIYNKYGSFLGRYIIKLLEIHEDYGIKKADYIITATPYIEKRCKKLTTNVSCIANFPIIHNNESVAKPFEEREKIVCYTGEISDTNGIFNMIEAMQQVNGNLYLTGSLSKELRDKLMKYNSWEKVCEPGYVDRKDIKKILQKSMVGLVLNLPVGNVVEDSPNKLFEYMEAGLPVIASDFPLWKEIVEKNGCGICVNPSKPEEIADAINRIFSSPKWAEEMGKNGRKLVQEKYNWGREEKKADKNISEKFLKEATLCYCGGMAEERNISMYVRMMGRINGKLLLAGSLSDSYKRELENIDSWEKVECLGYLDREEVNQLYKKSDIGLCILKNTPNIFYSWPIKLFEYMEAGLPVVCSGFPIWKQIVEENKCGIAVPYNDMEEAVKAVQYIMDYPEIAIQMGENGKKAVREKYNWQREEMKLFMVYKYLMKYIEGASKEGLAI